MGGLFEVVKLWNWLAKNTFVKTTEINTWCLDAVFLFYSLHRQKNEKKSHLIYLKPATSQQVVKVLFWLRSLIVKAVSSCLLCLTLYLWFLFYTWIPCLQPTKHFSRFRYCSVASSLAKPSTFSDSPSWQQLYTALCLT